MGSPLSSILPEIISQENLEVILTKLKSETYDFILRREYEYIFTLVIVYGRQDNEIETIQNRPIMNSHHNSLKCTVDKGKPNSIL